MAFNELRKHISHFLDDKGKIYFHYKGRVSLYALLKAMDVGAGDEIIVPAFTCVVVPNPIIYAGAKPVYVDIDPDTYNLNVDKLEAAITDKTKVIVCQNTYGLSSNVEKMLSIASRHKLFTIEDCTHGFGGTYEGKPNGSYCDASFFSTQWNKPFSSGVGGFAMVNNPGLVEKMDALENKKIPVAAKQKISLRFLYFTRRYLLNNATYFFLVRLYRWLSKNNMVVGSSSGEEISSVKKPDRFFMDYSRLQAKEALRNIKQLDGLLSLRKKNAAAYTEFLKSRGKNHVSEGLFPNHSFLKYPLLVSDRDAFFALAEKHKIPVGDWFISPLHPVTENFELWHFNTEKFPVAVHAAERVVNLPTDIKRLDKVLAFLEDNTNLIEDQL